MSIREEVTTGRFAFAVLLVTGVGFAIHVLYGRGWANDYVQLAARAGRLHILREPYPTYVVIVAFLTALLPTVGKALVYVLVKDQLPGESILAKGVAFGLLLLMTTDNLIRLPVMSLVVGNPVDVMLIQQLEGWAIGLFEGLLIALCIPSSNGVRGFSHRDEMSSRI